VINQVKRNLLGSSDWSPSLRNEKRIIAEQSAARLSEVWFAWATRFQ